MPNQGLSEISREELYELVWSTPATTLAERFGVSAVAIIKHCKKVVVPRPKRGYWAKREYGKAVDQPELPTSPTEALAAELLKPIQAIVSSQTPSQVLHPLASELLKRLKKGKVSYDGCRVHVRERELPESEVSTAQAERVATAFDALLKIVEARGIPFRRAQSSYDGGFFRKGHDRLYFKIEEELKAAVGLRSDRTNYYGGLQRENKVASGLITITLAERR